MPAGNCKGCGRHMWALWWRDLLCFACIPESSPKTRDLKPLPVVHGDGLPFEE